MVVCTFHSPTSGCNCDGPCGLRCVCVVATLATVRSSPASAVLEHGLSSELLQQACVASSPSCLSVSVWAPTLSDWLVITFPVSPSPISLRAFEVVCLSQSVFPFPAASQTFALCGVCACVCVCGGNVCVCQGAVCVYVCVCGGDHVCVCVPVGVSPLLPLSLPTPSPAPSPCLSLVRRPSWGQTWDEITRLGALSGEMAGSWAGLCAPALAGSGTGAQAWGQCCGARARVCARVLVCVCVRVCVCVSVRETETEHERRADTAANHPARRLHVGPSDTQPPALCSGAACSLHARTRTSAYPIRILLIGKVLGGQLSLPCLRTEGHLPRASPHPPSCSTPTPPPPATACQPSATWQPALKCQPPRHQAGPCLLAVWVPSTRQSPCPRSPRVLYVPQLLSTLG